MTLLSDCENGLIQLVKDSPLGKRLVTVGAMPQADGQNLVSRFGSEAPAVYVIPGRIDVKEEAGIVLSYALACTSRNARGQVAVRQGDAKTLGLYQIIEGVIGELNGGLAGGIRWYVESADYLRDEVLARNGIYVAMVYVQSAPVILESLDESALAEFCVFDSQYDIAPHESGEEHDQWLAEPPDHTRSTPELTDQLKLRE